MKFDVEVDFCEEVCRLIAGIFAETKREKVIFVPEVSYDYTSNKQVDMMLLDVKNLEYLFIEFKLKSYKELLYQIHRLHRENEPIVGIINSKPRKITPDEKEFYYYIPESYKVFSYTGLDEELELLGSREKGLLYPHRWWSVYHGRGMVYYWAYKNRQSNFRGGITTGNRDGFATIYMEAIKNLHVHYGKLDFMLTHAALSSGYSLPTSKKYFNKAVRTLATGACNYAAFHKKQEQGHEPLSGLQMENCRQTATK